MNTHLFHTPFRLLLNFNKIITILGFSILLFSSKVNAISPQDSSHYSSSWPLLSDELWIYNAKVIDKKVWYSYNNGCIRARNFRGEVVFNYQNTATNFVSHDYDVSKDGRLYHFYQPPDSNLQRVAIVSPEGTRIGDFGPFGKGAGLLEPNETLVAVSPVSGRIYLGDKSETLEKKGLVRVFDRDGNFLHQFRTNGVLATTLEGPISHMIVRGDAEGNDEVYVVDTVRPPNGSYLMKSNLKIFRGDGSFLRLPSGGVFNQEYSYYNPLNTAFFWNERLVFSENWGKLYIGPADLTKGEQMSAIQTPIEASKPGYYLGFAIGVDEAGAWIKSDVLLGVHFYSYPNISNFDAKSRNAVPNPWVLGITQRPGSGIVDIDYCVDDVNDSTVTTALVGFANGVASLTNVLPLNTLMDGTGARLGANQPTGQSRRVTWNAGADWNVDFGTLRVMALARDSRTNWFDVHLVEIPADGTRPAVAISRNPLREEDFLAQFFWLVATKDPSVRLVDGVLFGTTGADNGVILANGTTATAAGRTFLLKRDGLRVATTEEITRAREGATPGFTVRLTPPLRMLRNTSTGSYIQLPDYINEFGIESSGYGNETDRWYVVRSSSN